MKSRSIQEFKETEIGKIPPEWEVDKLENHLIIKGRIGWKGLKTSEYTNDGPFIVTGIQIKEKKVAWDECSHITEDRYNESPEIMLHENDILMTKDGTIGKLAYIENISHKSTVASHIHVIRKKSEKILPRFLFYVFESPQFKNVIESKITGSVVPALTQKDINSTLFPIPPISEQKSISKIFYDLDTKIQNLQNQNKILEQITQAIFKSWFIDFDGVTEFDDSELGQIPKGWTVRKISGICETFGGGTPSTTNPNYWNGNNYWFVPRDLTNSDRLFCISSERKITDLGLKNCSSQLHPENSILMTSRATIGAFAINRVPAATNQGFIVTRPNNPNHLYYLFLNFVNRVDEFISNANGSTFLEISRGNFKQLPILIPSASILDIFHNKIKQCFEKQFVNEQQILTLTEIRDSLLPKLMSGEIQV